jgi:hypothetical protein
LDNSGGSGDLGSLRHCMQSQFNQINFEPNLAGEIRIETALPTINWTVNIDGPGDDDTPAVTVIRLSTTPFRIFDISSGVTVNILDLGIANGQAANGAGIQNQGTLALTRCLVEDNIATSSDNQSSRVGGGIQNLHVLTVNSSVIRNNQVFGNSTFAASTYGGAGIHSKGTLSIVGSTIDGNLVCPGVPSPNACPGTGFVFFWGAGILSEEGTTSISFSSVTGNILKAIDPGELAVKGEGGGLRSLCQDSDCLFVSYSTFSGNEVLISGEATQEAPTSALGGGIGVSPLIESSNISMIEDMAAISNTTFVGNKAISSVTEVACVGTCRTSGGALWFKQGEVTVEFCTIALNEVGNVPNRADGGGINRGSDSVLNLRATIVANNEADTPTANLDNISGGPMTSLGHNLFNDRPAGATGTGDLTNMLVCFFNLADYGGSSQFAHTKTLQPKGCAGSSVWARNNGPSSGPTDDQRTFTRPEGAATNIGAFECQGTSECPFEGSGAPGSGSGSGGVNPTLATAESPTAARPHSVAQTVQPCLPTLGRNPLARDLLDDQLDTRTSLTVTPRRQVDARASTSDQTWRAFTDPIWESF